MALHALIQKSRGGCLTCKRRHVKCDEGKPVCDRCKRAGVFCEGYSLFVAAESGFASQATVTPLGDALTPFRLSPSEMKAYSAYRHQAVLFGGPNEHAFWKDLVLQISAADEAIRQCIFAVGSIIRHVQKHGLLYDIKACRCNDCRFAVLSYNRAIKSVIECKIPSGKTDVAALACAMFVSLEMLQGNDDRVLDLVEKGYSVMCQETMNTSVTAKSPSSLVSALWPIFGRLRVLVQLSGRPLLSLQNDGIQFTRLVSTFDQLRGKLHELQGDLHPYLIATTLARWSNYADCDVVDLYSQHSKHQSALTAWFEMFKEWSSKSPQTSDVEERFGIPLLKASYLITSIWSSTALCPSKTRFSNHYDSFAQVLDLAALGLEQSEQDMISFPFEFETGFMPLLFFAATRCRNIVLRSRAMDLLTRTKLREGTWDRAEVIAVTKRFVQLEAVGGIDIIPTIQGIHPNEHPTCFDDVHIGKRYTFQGKLTTTVTYYWVEESLGLCSKKENIQIST